MLCQRREYWASIHVGSRLAGPYINNNTLETDLDTPLTNAYEKHSLGSKPFPGTAKKTAAIKNATDDPPLPPT